MDVNIAIVGAGLAGAATAYHLSKLGVEDIVLLEQESMPGQHASGLNAAMVREVVEDDDVQVLASEGAAELRTGRFADYRRTGGFLIGEGSDDVSTQVPIAQGRGLWCPEDGVTDPAGLLQNYLRGQTVRCDTRVEAWRCTHDGVELATSTGVVHARTLVNAAGPWAGVLGDLKLSPRNRHLMVTRAMPTVDGNWPWVWDVVNGLYFRPESGGLLLCPCDEQERSPGDYRVDEEALFRLARLLNAHQASLSDVSVRKSWTGQRTFSADRKFVIGFDPRYDCLFHVAGLGGHGVTCSYAVGRLAAELLTGKALRADNPFDPARLLLPRDESVGDAEVGEIADAR